MLKKIISIIKRPTNKNVIINTLGNYFGVFFTAFFALILVRILNPSQYGILSVLLGIAYVLSNILDFGTTATIYSTVPGLLEKKSTEIYQFIKSIFFYQSIFSAVVITTLIIFFPYLDRVFFKTGAPIIQLYLTCISVLFFIWQNFIFNILLASKKFLKVNVYINIANLIKSVVIFIMAITHMVTVGSVIVIFGILGPLIFFFLLLIEKKERVFILWKARIHREHFKFSYTFTYFLASQLFNLGLRMDLFLLSYFLSKSEVGYYGLSQKIILTVSTTIISITQVLSPHFSQIKLRHEIKHYLKTASLYMLLPTALFVLLYLTPPQVFQLFFTNKFVKTAQITKALSLPFILYAVGIIPSLFLLYTVKKPIYILFSNIVFFVVITGGSYVLIPIKGVFGPPMAIFVAFFLTVLLQILAVIREYQKLPA